MKLILTGDVNLMNVTDPSVPFARVADELRDAVTFSNFECCLFDPGGHSFHNEGFHAHPGPGGEALKLAGIDAVGIANNVNYGEAAILGSIVIRGHTAYHVPMHKTRPETPPPNRPGVPPEIVTWADAAYLRAFADDIAKLKERADIVVASCHWGLGQEVLEYMSEIAHAAIDAGAHVVMGHGPHYSLPVEVYQGRPIFYGLGSFSFHTGHGGRQHGDWLGMMVRAEIARDGLKRTRFRFVRHNDRNETVLCALASERAAFDDLARRSAQLNARLTAHGDEVLVEPAA